MGRVALPEMKRYKYSDRLATGAIAAGGTLGILIPPSIVMVVYAASVDVSVGRTFLAGVIPGIVAGLMLMTAIYIVAKVRGLPSQPKATWREWFTAAWDAGWGLFLIVIILGGIYGGIFTPTEAAAVAAVYAFFIANFIYRDMGPLRGTGDKPIRLRDKPSAIFTAWVHPDTKRTLLEAGKPHTVLPLSGVTHMTPQEEVAENLLLVQLAFLREALGIEA